MKPSNDINQIQKTVSHEQETQTNIEQQTQTTESQHFSEVQTQSDNFLNMVPVISNPIYSNQPNETNKPVYRIVVPKRVENNESINFISNFSIDKNKLIKKTFGKTTNTPLE